MLPLEIIQQLVAVMVLILLAHILLFLVGREMQPLEQLLLLMVDGSTIHMVIILRLMAAILTIHLGTLRVL